MTTLYLPDLHNRVEQHQKIIDDVRADTVVHLGDYWDDYDDTPSHARVTADWVLGRETRGDVMLLGNHDIWYLTDRNHMMCSGNTREKRNVIREIIPEGIRENFRLFDYREGWLATHAGFDGRLAKNTDAALRELDNAQDAYIFGMPHRLIDAIPFRRGGDTKIGGVLWQDWRDLVPVPGLNQIVGHTITPYPQSIVTPKATTHNIDTNSRSYGVLEDGKMTIHFLGDL
jgi:calcineurin-like phosphoesterase family protein